MTTPVYLNRIETALPATEVHEKFVSYIPRLISDARREKVFDRLVKKAQIESRYSVVSLSSDENKLDTDGLYRSGNFASTGKRMDVYKREAFPLARNAVRKIFASGDVTADEITHLIVTSCTGFYAPGLDLELQKYFEMRPDVERTVIGFMGCYAGINALKSAWHIVRSQPKAKVLLVNLEICTIHLQESSDFEKLLSFLQFGDGCAVSLLSSEPIGLRLDRFRAQVAPEGKELIQWHIGDQGFDMVLSMDVPQALVRFLPNIMNNVMTAEEKKSISLWAIHPGGRSILDVVQDQLKLSVEDLRFSREVLRRCGNMSSATVLFVLKEILEDDAANGNGAAFAFGPGLTVETMMFNKAVKKSGVS
jgi:alpha-pyrone synthase